MKKILLSALLFAGAIFVQAKEVVVFEEDFEWIEPWLSPAVLDNVGEDHAKTSTPRFDGLANEGVYLRNALWNRKGEATYWFYGIKKDGSSESALGGVSVYAAANYLKFGKTDVQTYMRFQGCEEVPADAQPYLEFDWCPQKQGDGMIDLIKLEVAIQNGGAVEEVAFETEDHNWEKGHKLEWIHEVVDLEGFDINENTRIHIRPVKAYWGVAGVHRYYLDNIKIAYQDEDQSGIEDITVNEDNDAPVEYFNLQGVRVNNPENGLYIRRQGKHVSKCIK